MGGYVVFARKYRPRTFDEVVGQEVVARTLRNAIEMGRVPHAMLFSGPRGVGKTTMARILARALNCERGPTPEPCDTCEICEDIWSGRDMDVIEIDGASNNSVDDVRQLRERAGISPSRSRFKVYIIDEVHMLSRAAFNALLKTLEEPPAHVKFIFATTEVDRVPDTVRSRCQRFDFAPIRPERIVARLEEICRLEDVEYEEDALKRIALHAGGSMRDASSILDQAVSFGGGKVSAADVDGLLGTVSDERLLSLIRDAVEGDVAGALRGLEEIVEGGADVHAVASQMVGLLRDVLLVSAAGKKPEEVDPMRGREALAAVGEMAGRFDVPVLLYSLRLLMEAERQMKRSISPAVYLESALIKMADARYAGRLGEIVSMLEKGDFASSPGVSPAPAVPPDRPSVPPAHGERRAGQQRSGLQDERWSDAWTRVREELKGMGKHSLGALLLEAYPSAVEGKRLVVAVNYAYHKEELEKSENRLMLEDVLEAVLGERYEIEFVSARRGDEGGKDRVSGRGGDLVNDPAVRAVVDVLGGRPVSMRGE